MANNQLIASDNFASGSLAAGWSAIFGMSVTPVINVPPFTSAPGALSTNYGQIWTALGALGNQISEVTLGAGFVQEAGTYVNIAVRQQLGASSRYEIDITGGGTVNCTINVIVAGVPTTVATAATQTAAAGDIWTVTADGACISVYRNFQRILFVMDATFTTGYPGYFQYSSVNTTHSQVVAWRGYNCVQQNGIWQKQGVIIPPLAADLASSGFGTFNNSQVFHEGNAQLLSGTVYKIWFSVGGATTAAIAYAESLDGINWTRRGSNVITGFLNPSVIKVGGTFYLFCQPQPGGSGNFAQYTSTDGVTWTQQSTTILGPGTTGQWDAGGVYFFCPVTITGGTWYALYIGVATGSTQYSTGLATSSNGLTWTKYGSNPVLSYAQGSITNGPGAIVNLAGVYYMWCGGSQNNVNGGNFLDPTSTVRYSSPDLIHWTKSSNSGLWYAQFSQGVNTAVGQAIPDAIIDIGGKAYLYNTSSALDGALAAYQVSLAIAPVPTASVVTQPEDGVKQYASDTFARANGGLGANWQTLPTYQPPQIVGNLVQAQTLATNAGAAYIGASFASDQYSECTVQAMTGGNRNAYINPVVRASLVAATWYEAEVYGNTGNVVPVIGTGIYRRVAGAATLIGPMPTFYPNVGDVWRLSAVGNVLSLFQNGFLILQVQDFGATAIASGVPGFVVYVAAGSLVDAQMSAWAGGNANVLPSYPPSGGGDLGPGYDFKFRM
jgi:hypothetical protein